MFITTPLGHFSALDIFTVGILRTTEYIHSVMSTPKRSALESRRELSENARIVRYWYPLGCRALELGKQPQGNVIYTVVVYRYVVQYHTARLSYKIVYSVGGTVHQSSPNPSAAVIVLGITLGWPSVRP